jgi:hypothetical protein
MQHQQRHVAGILADKQRGLLAVAEGFPPSLAGADCRGPLIALVLGRAGHL